MQLKKQMPQIINFCINENAKDTLAKHFALRNPFNRINILTKAVPKPQSTKSIGKKRFQSICLLRFMRHDGNYLYLLYRVRRDLENGQQQRFYAGMGR